MAGDILSFAIDADGQIALSAARGFLARAHDTQDGVFVTLEGPRSGILIEGVTLRRFRAETCLHRVLLVRRHGRCRTGHCQLASIGSGCSPVKGCRPKEFSSPRARCRPSSRDVHVLG
ncbi:hypothetical protein F2981_32465 (plasmid) [Sinorhizobium meliloti]|nr:hypothetical protein [Sinorhizobium meliloti]